MVKSKLSENEVKHVAKLANLVLTQTEIEKFRKQLSAVLDYVEILKGVKTEKIRPTSQVTNLGNVFREDKAGPSLSQEEVLSGSRDKKEGMLKTKAIFAA